MPQAVHREKRFVKDPGLAPRTMEPKELSVPVSKLDDLRKFYRIIASDERNTAVMKPQ